MMPEQRWQRRNTAAFGVSILWQFPGRSGHQLRAFAYRGRYPFIEEPGRVWAAVGKFLTIPHS